MGIGTNTAEWKTTKRHICRSSSYWLSKLTTERLYYFVVKIYHNQIELQLFPLAVVNGSSLRAEEKEKNSLFLYRLYVRRTTSYGKRVGQMNKLVLPFLGSPFRRWMGATRWKKIPETENCWAIHNLSPKMSVELICYFPVAKKFKTSGCQTFLNWKCQQLCSNSKSTENNCRKNVAWIKRVMIFEKSQDKRITLF